MPNVCYVWSCAYISTCIQCTCYASVCMLAGGPCKPPSTRCVEYGRLVSGILLLPCFRPLLLMASRARWAWPPFPAFAWCFPSTGSPVILALRIMWPVTYHVEMNDPVASDDTTLLLAFKFKKGTASSISFKHWELGAPNTNSCRTY